MFKKAHTLWKKEIGELLRKAGYLKPTPLQKKVIPVILKGKNIAIEAGDRTGKTAAFILPVLEMMHKNRAGIKALVLTSSFDRVKKITREFHKFIQYFSKEVNVTLIGSEKGSRKEFRLLSQKPDIVIGTTSRVIDHIRRGNLSFDGLQFQVIDGTDMEKFPGFEPDLHFIATKLPQQLQTILFSPVPLSSLDNLLSTLHRPLTVGRQEWEKENERPDYSWLDIEKISQQKRISVLCEFITTKSINSLLLYADNEETISILMRSLKHGGFPVKRYSNKIEEGKKDKICNAFNQKKIPVLVASPADIQNPKSFWPSHILYFDVPVQSGCYSGLTAMESHGIKEIIFFITGKDMNKLTTTEEMKNVDIKKEPLPSEKDVVKGMTAEIIKKIREEEDADDLNALKKMVKQHVPFYMRSYFMAYLFKELMGKRFGKKKSAITTLFISVGKNRHVFPNDLVSLFTEHLKIKRSEIKEVKVLDNYSFLDISSRHASRAISVLSGKELKGKVINVNYARKKSRGRRSGNNNKAN
ncbi:MAG: DEAD/DEAH box helicase [Spirochaetales bacterium]|nr:DEAD/DEAH box helicase [Spirochaetales bacterium]